jgi:hypothetical protein
MAEKGVASTVDAWRELDRALRMDGAECLIWWSERKGDY